MLDLNFGAFQNMEEEEQEDQNRTAMEEDRDSRTTILNSSIVNDEEIPSCRDDEDSVFIFDILKKESSSSSSSLSPSAIKNDVRGGFTSESSEFVKLRLANNPFSRSALSTQWLNLSFAESAGQSQREVVKTMQQQNEQQKIRKSRRGPRSRSSQYRGVTFYRRTGRWESHIWDCGKQVYLGGFDTAHSAARAYDQAAIKFRGVEADINFKLSDYEEDLTQKKNLSKEEFVQLLRRSSTGLSRASSKFRGATLHTRWEARMGKTNNGGSRDHHLDLRLGISLASDSKNGSKGITDEVEEKRMGFLNYPYAVYEDADRKRLKIMEGTKQAHILTMASSKQHHPAPIWPAIHSRFLPNNGEHGIFKKQIPSSSIAASSGFSSSTSTTVLSGTAASALPLLHLNTNTNTNTNNNSVLNFFYSVPTKF